MSAGRCNRTKVFACAEDSWPDDPIGRGSVKPCGQHAYVALINARAATQIIFWIKPDRQRPTFNIPPPCGPTCHRTLN